MRLILFLIQIALLAAGFSSNRQDAMIGAAVFCVVLVAIAYFDALGKASQRSNQPAKTNRSHP
jgi:hypothetical protein